MDKPQPAIRSPSHACAALWFGVLLVGILAFAGAAFAEAAPPTRGKVFEEVWRTVRDEFFDPHFNGVDWDDAHRRYATPAVQARSDEEFAAVVNAMLAELRTSHTRLYTRREPEYYQLCGIFLPYLQPKLRAFLPGGRPDYTGIGIGTHTSGGKTFIHYVLDGLPAAQAGLHAGDEIIDVDNAPFEPVTSFAGKEGQAVSVRVRRAVSAEPVVVSVTPLLLDPTEMFIGAMRNSVEVTEQAGVKIGYIHVWSYAGEVYQDQLEKELDGRLREADALVLDLRDGWGGANPRYLWPFFAPPLAVTFTGRDGTGGAHQEAWTKPVCLLVNEGTRSGKEVLTYAFDKAGRGPIVGTRTAGAVMAGRPFVMGDGSLLLLAVMDGTVDGVRLEGRGVTPTVEVPFRPVYTGGADPQKARAMEIIAKEPRR